MDIGRRQIKSLSKIICYPILCKRIITPAYSHTPSCVTWEKSKHLASMALGLAIDTCWPGECERMWCIPCSRKELSEAFFSCAVNTAMAPGRFSSLLGCWMRKHMEQTSSLAAVHGQWKHDMSKPETFVTIKILELLLLQQNWLALRGTYRLLTRNSPWRSLQKYTTVTWGGNCDSKLAESGTEEWGLRFGLVHSLYSAKGFLFCYMTEEFQVGALKLDAKV